MASAKALADRYKALGDTNAVSKQDADNAVAAELQAEADVESGQAAVETAHINLVYTKVLSPITGRTGISVTEGALVTANQTTPLVTVQQLDPIYVDIPQSTALLLRLRRELAGGQIKGSGENQAPVTLTLEDGSNRTIKRGNCSSPKPRSIKAPARSPCARSFPIRKSCCCPACLSPPTWRKA
jgi:membrane fusion protein (multidrug efflux system)